MFKKLVQRHLEKLTKKYLQRQKPILILITGSVGKTSTKLAIATVLAERFRVRTHEGNYNTEMSTPLAIMGVEYPEKVHSLWSWLAVFRAARLRIRAKQRAADVIIQELGTDAPGDIARFGEYLQADVAVVTAVSPEHMEFFKTMEAVAQEELAVAGFSKVTAINRDDIPGQYSEFITSANITTYGTSGAAEYRFVSEEEDLLEGFKGKIVAPELGEVPVTLRLVGEHSTKAATAAGAVAAKLGLSAEEISRGMAKIRPVKGRMNILRGLEDSVLIDDTYNSSPLAVEAALQTLYRIQAPQRIAILGSMNELGEMSREAHERAGQLCDPNVLNWVITIGEEAGKYLAPAARARGCQVRSFHSPIKAGAFAHKVLEPRAVVLAKGSQDGVFAEEALKVILHATVEEHDLVRQTPAWLEKKQKQFDDLQHKA